MKKIMIGALIGLVSIGSAYATQCTYNFDATQSQITGADPSLLKFPTITGQKTSFNISAHSGVKSYMAASSQFLNATNNLSDISGGGDISTPNSGIFAYEYKVKVPTFLLSAGESLATFPLGGMGFNTSSQSLSNFIVAYGNNIYNLPGQNFFNIYIDDPSLEKLSLPVATTSDGYQRLGVYINQDSKQIGVIFNGVNKGYIGSIADVLESYAFVNIFAQYDISTTSSSIGTNISIELITDHADLEFTYPSGTKDICGNTI